MDKKQVLYGKNEIQGIVGLEWRDGDLIVFTEDVEGVSKTKIKHFPYTLFDGMVFKDLKELDGDLPLKYFKKYSNTNKQRKEYFIARKKGFNCWKANSIVEGAMISKGLTFYKGMSPKDVSTLSFDIETTSIDPEHKDAKILSVACTYRKGSIMENKLFAYDDYPSEENMILDFADYVRKMDPSILTGYNILGFDIPYILKRHPVVKLGRNAGKLYVEEQTREKRKDSSQSYSFHAAHCYGRQIIDAFHLVIDYDLANGRELPSYRLKEVMSFLKLEKEGRQHFDASKIKDLYQIPEEWEKIKAYNIDDGEDVIKILDYVWEPYFYFTQHIPMSFERVTQTATGTKVNNLMLRAYIQQKHSVPLGDPKEWYEGGMVVGNPGIYDWVNKVDVKSMYPSIMIMKKLCVKHKDPLRVFPMITKTFTEERLSDKKKFAETGDKYYDSQQAAKKIFINSLYGFLGAGRLNFNSMDAADSITEEGRNITRKGIEWAESKGWAIVNADTDSFSYTTGNEVGREEFLRYIDELNALYPDEIEWEDDGQYKHFLVLKAKNYVLIKPNGTKIVKGNSIKATNKEPALQDFITELIDYLFDRRPKSDLIRLYFNYVLYINGIHSVDSIGPWCSKVTVTKAVLEKTDTRQKRIRDAIRDSTYSESDKIYIFFETSEKVTLKENFNGTYDRDKLYGKLHSTAKTFQTVIDTSIFPNFKLKRNKQLLELVKTDFEKAVEKVCNDTGGNNEGLPKAAKSLSEAKEGSTASDENK